MVTDTKATMTADQVSEFALGHPEAIEDHPFGPALDVFKVGGKVFGLLTEDRVSLKCDPKESLRLRDEYPAITAGYHLNKRHWNTVELDGSVPEEEVRWMVRHSYELVVGNLSKEDRVRLQGS